MKITTIFYQLSATWHYGTILRTSLGSHFLMGCLKKLIPSDQDPNRKDSRNHWGGAWLRKPSLINVCGQGNSTGQFELPN